MTGVLGDLLAEFFSRGGRLTNLTSGEDAQYNALIAGAGAIARTLQSHNLLPNEPVHVRIGNRPQDLASMLGIWLAGGVVVPVHVSAASHTLQGVRNATGARLMVNCDAVEAIALKPPAPRALLEGAALIIFTSGTTGIPKGVVITHSAFAGKLAVLGDLLNFRTDDVVLLPLQLTFIFGIWVAFLALRSGSRLLLVQKLDNSVLETAVANGISIFAAVPSLLRMVLAGPVSPGEQLRMVLTGGEALGPVLSDQLSASWPTAKTIDLYGSTETGACDFWHVAGSLGVEGLIGRPTENVRFRIVDLSGQDVVEGAPGELLIHTPYGMAGYLDNPDLTQSSFIGSYYQTGDLARSLPDRCVALVGRLKELISRGGNKIAPQEIDNLLSSHPSVAASLTTGLPDARLGETIHSAVVLVAGHETTPEALREWMAARIERFKLPEVFVIMNFLPTGPTGKASRAAFKEFLLSR